MLCNICFKSLDIRRDVRWEMKGSPVGTASLCSLACLWKFRGKHRIV